MQTLRRILVVVLLMATPLVAAVACSTAPRPPASDTVGNAIYDLDDVIGTVWFVFAVARCISDPGSCTFTVSAPF